MKQFTGPPNKVGAKKPARILLIEDNPAEVHLLRVALNEHGDPYALHVLDDGAEALWFVREQRAARVIHPEPCVIVLDLHLPKHDGPEILRAIKEEPVLAHIHVIVLTTTSSPRDEHEVRQLGVRLYRQKPTTLDDLMQVTRQILDICHGLLS